MAEPFLYTEGMLKALFSTRDLSPDEKTRFLAMKAAFETQALYVLRNTPPTHHQTIAINKIIEAKDAACLGFITAGIAPFVVEVPPPKCPFCQDLGHLMTKDGVRGPCTHCR